MACQDNAPGVKQPFIGDRLFSSVWPEFNSAARCAPRTFARYTRRLNGAANTEVFGQRHQGCGLRDWPKASAWTMAASTAAAVTTPAS